MKLRLLCTSIIVFLIFGFSKAQTNSISIASGLGYRISNMAIFGQTSQFGKHSDVPGISYSIDYSHGLKIIPQITGSSLTLGFKSIGVNGKRVHYESIPNPVWGGTMTDEYYLQYQVKYQFLTIGLKQLVVGNDKWGVELGLGGTYNFRGKNITLRRYPQDSGYWNYDRIKTVSSKNTSNDNRIINVITTSSLCYKLNRNSSVFCELGTFLSNNTNSVSTSPLNITPHWFIIGFKYSILSLKYKE